MKMFGYIIIRLKSQTIQIMMEPVAKNQYASKYCCFKKQINLFVMLYHGRVMSVVVHGSHGMTCILELMAQQLMMF